MTRQSTGKYLDGDLLKKALIKKFGESHDFKIEVRRMSIRIRPNSGLISLLLDWEAEYHMGDTRRPYPDRCEYLTSLCASLDGMHVRSLRD